MMNILIKKQTSGLVALLFMLLTPITHSDSQSILKTKRQLQQIESKMSQLKHHIHRTHDKQLEINKQLSITEKKLHQGYEQLKQTRLEMSNKQRRITALAQQINLLNDQLHHQQQLLADHIRSGYKHNKTYEKASLEHLLILNQYLIHSRLSAIEKIRTIKKGLLLNENKLHQELITQTQLQQQLNSRQQAFNNEKRKRTSLMSSLARDIETQQQALQNYERNKANLSRLLAVLAQKSVIQTNRPFTRMRKKLKKPVVKNADGIRKMNQGVIFFANEGSPVSAIFPGRVVFADWLNGYGLLVIIDHGMGSMTLYSNNSTLLKHKGDLVRQGEKIATVGHTGTMKKNGLYFEIRQRGKAVNPLEWMS